MPLALLLQIRIYTPKNNKVLNALSACLYIIPDFVVYMWHDIQ